MGLAKPKPAAAKAQPKGAPADIRTMDARQLQDMCSGLRLRDQLLKRSTKPQKKAAGA